MMRKMTMITVKLAMMRLRKVRVFIVLVAQAEPCGKVDYSIAAKGRWYFSR